MPDHVHLCIEMPPKYAVASVIGFLKGQSAIAIARQFGGRERNVTGEHFWARGYAVSTVGFALEQVRAYIRAQEQADEQGRFEVQPQGRDTLATMSVGGLTAFEAAPLIKPLALPGCDQEVRNRTLATPHKVCEEVSNKEIRNRFEPRDVRVSLPRRADE